MTQWLRVLTTVAEDLAWFLSTNIVPHKLLVAPAPWDREPLSDLHTLLHAYGIHEFIWAYKSVNK